MAGMPSLNQLRQNYRIRYYNNRGQDLPDLKPGNNAVDFVANYLNITASNSDCEDSIVRRSFPAHVASRSRIQQSREKEAQDSSTKPCVNDTPQYSKGHGHLMTNTDPPAIPYAFKKNERQPEKCDDKLFSDEESDDEESIEVAKLIEESFPEGDAIADDMLMSNSENPKEQLYSSDTSVFQEPLGPISNIHAKKWLSFKDSTFAANDNVVTNVVSGTSEEFTNNAQQLKQQETVNANDDDSSYNLHTDSPDNRPKDEFVIEEQNSIDMFAWHSPFKKKKTTPLSTTSKDEKLRSTPNSSSLKRKSERVKASLSSTTTPERPKDEFVAVESSSPLSNKKKGSSLSSRSKEDKPTTSKKTNSFEASSSLKKKSENVKASLNSSATAESFTNAGLDSIAYGQEDGFVIDEENSGIWTLSFKQKKASPLSTRLKEDKRTTPKKNNPFEVSSNLKRKSENVKASLTNIATAERLSLVSEAPNISTTVSNNKEDLVNEDISDSNLINPVKTKTIQTCSVSKRKQSVPQLLESTSDDDDGFESDVTVIKLSRKQDLPLKDLKESLPIHPVKTVNIVSSNASRPSHTEVSINLPPEAVLPQVVQDIEPQGTLSQDAEVQRVVEDIEKEKSVYKEGLPVENQEKDDSDSTENDNLNNIKQLHQTQQTRRSDRIKSDWDPRNLFDLSEKFNIRIRKGGAKATAKKRKNSKLPKEKDKPLLKVKKANVEEKSKTQKSNKPRKSSKARNGLESAKDCLSNDVETAEVLENSTTECASRKKLHMVEVDETNKEKNEKRAVCEQPHNESLEIGNGDEQDTGTYAALQPKKRQAKLKNINTPCPVDLSKEGSIFQSGPVTRQRAVPFAVPLKPLDLDYMESTDEEHDSSERDEFIVNSGEEMVAADCIAGSKTDAQISEEQEELLKRYSIVFDPDTRSDALVECIAYGERSKFVGNDYCTCWNSFNNNIFTTGKMIIAPRKKTETRISLSKIVVYYVEQGLVQVNLHKTVRTLQNGDFFFVPPGNSCMIANLQDKEAVMVFNLLKMLPVFTEG